MEKLLVLEITVLYLSLCNSCPIKWDLVGLEQTQVQPSSSSGMGFTVVISLLSQ